MSATCATAQLCPAGVRRQRALPRFAAAPRCAATPSSSEQAASPSTSGSGPLAWFSAARENARSSFVLTGRAAAAALVANLPAVPSPLRAQAGSEARTHAAALLYKGDAERMDSDLRWYGDGFTLLARDVSRDGRLLLRSEADLTPRQLAARKRIAADARALLPFTLLVSNTFPFTRFMLEPALQRGLPRHWVLPSAFEDSRLRLVHRARKLGARTSQDHAQ